MHLAIDFGTSYTKLGYMINGSFVSLTDSKGIPTVFAYIRDSDELVFGYNALKVEHFYFKHYLKTPHHFKVGNYTLYDILFNYFSFLKENFILPHNLNLDTVNLSTPNYIGINAKRLLINSLSQVFKNTKINLVPEPVAAIIGQTMVNKHTSLDGDILVIDMDGSSINFSFLTLFSDRQEIMMESSFQVILDDFTEIEKLNLFLDQNIRNEARKLGIYSNNIWKLDDIILVGENSHDKEVYEFFNNYFSPLRVTLAQDANLNIVKGLATWPDSPDIATKLIYPFDFYIKKYNTESTSFTLDLIPFDTVNLDLDIKGKYTLCSLPLKSHYNLSTDKNLVKFMIYEISKDTPVEDIEMFSGEEIEVQVDLSNDELIDFIDIEFDLYNWELMVSYTQANYEVNKTDSFDNYLVGQNLAWLDFAEDIYNQELKTDLELFLNNTDISSELTLDEHLELVKFKLLALLQYIS